MMGLLPKYSIFYKAILNAWVVPGTPKSSWLKQLAGADYFLAAICRWTLTLRPVIARWRRR